MNGRNTEKQQSYSIFDYGGMINDKNKVRTEAFSQALKNAIGPDTVVLDIGTGTGYFALLAAKLGAKHVYAIEYNPAIQLGREAAVDNGLVDRMTFIQDMSTKVDLPEKVDVIISDIGGALPLSGPLVASLKDAQERFLKPGGKMIPEQDVLCAAVVNAPGIYGSYVDPWANNAAGLNLGCASRRAVCQVRKQPFKSKNIVGVSQEWATVDYENLDSPNFDGELQLVAAESGAAHGVTLWFDRVFADGQKFSNAPGEPGNPIYSNLFLPWTDPVELAEGDQVTVKLRAAFVNGNYVWSWQTTILADTDENKARFSQSSFLSQFKGIGQPGRGGTVEEQDETVTSEQLAVA